MPQNIHKYKQLVFEENDVPGLEIWIGSASFATPRLMLRLPGGRTVFIYLRPDEVSLIKDWAQSYIEVGHGCLED